MPFVGPAHASHPALAVTDAHHADDAADPPVDRAGPYRRRAAVAGAVKAQPTLVDLVPSAQEGERGLDVGDTAVRIEARARSFALAPSLVVEGEHDVAGLVERARVVRQVEVLDPGIAVAQHDPGPRLARLDSVRTIQVANEPEPLGIKRDGDRAHEAAPRSAGPDDKPVTRRKVSVDDGAGLANSSLGNVVCTP